jgi:hypothetical protein
MTIEQPVQQTVPTVSTKKWFWQNGLSIDETKLSALILCLFGCLIFGGINYSTIGDISANLTTIITALIYSIAGVNITNSIVNRFSTANNKSVQTSPYMMSTMATMPQQQQAVYMQETKMTTANQNTKPNQKPQNG